MGLAALALVSTRRVAQGHQRGALAPAAAISSETIGAASFIGFTGVIAAYGFDGLAFPLGIAAGMALLAILIAPRFAQTQSTSVAAYFASRFGGVWPMRLALMITAVASVLILAASLRGGALAVQGLAGTTYPTSAVIAAVVTLLVCALAFIVPMRWPAAAAFGFVLLAFLIPLVWLTLHQGRFALPHIAYGQAISDVAALEQKLMASRLADFKSLKPLAQPFLAFSMTNFAGIVVSLALGLAALPSLLSGIAAGGTAGTEASSRIAIATALAVIFLLGIPAMAVFLRAGVAELIGTGLQTPALPSAILKASGLGWADVCGAQSFSAAELAAACSKLSGQKGLLRLQDLAITNDAFLFSASAFSALPRWALSLLMAGGLAASAFAGSAVLRGVATNVRPAEPDHARGTNVAPVAAAAILLVASLAVATFGSADMPTLLSEALSIIAAGIFPALVLGLYWRRMGTAGAVVAMVSGFILAALYVAGVRLFPVAMFEWTGALSNAAPGAVRKFADLQATLSASAGDNARAAASSALVRHAQSISNWWGLKPAAFVLIAAPIGLAAGVVATLLSPRSAQRL